MKTQLPKRQHAPPSGAGIRASGFEAKNTAGALTQSLTKVATEWEGRMRAATLAAESVRRKSAFQLETDQWLHENAKRPGSWQTLEADLGAFQAQQLTALDDIRDEEVRTVLRRDIETAQTQSMLRARHIARGQQRTEALAGLNEGLANYQRLAAETPDGRRRALYMDSALSAISGQEQAGFLDATRAEDLRQRFVNETWADYTALAIQKDPATALRHLKRDEEFPGFDVGARATRIRQAKITVRERERERNQIDALTRAELSDAMAGEIARIETTGQTRAGVLERVRDTLGEKQAAVYARERDKALSVFDKTSRLKDAHPREAARLLERWKSEENFQDFQRIADQRRRQIKQLTEDPGAYTSESVVAGALRAAIQDQDAERSEALAGALLEEQGRLGLPKQSRRILPRQQAAGEAVAIAEMAPAQAAERLDGLKNLYGTRFPNVMQSLVEAGLPPAMEALTWTENPVARQAMVAAARDGKTLGDALPEADKREIRETLATELEPFRNTLFLTDEGGRTVHGNAPVDAKVTHALTLLATQYAHGMGAASAAQKAYKDIIGDSYHFEDDYRLPARVDPYQMKASLERRLDDLEPVGWSELANPNTSPPGSEAELPGQGLPSGSLGTRQTTREKHVI